MVEEKKNQANPGLTEKIAILEEQIKQLREENRQLADYFEDYLLFTRELAILKGAESLPFLQYQIKRQLYEYMAQGKMLTEVQEELGIRWNEFQTAKREETRTKEMLDFLVRYTDAGLKNMEALRSEKQKLETSNKLLQQQLEAKDQVIQGYEKLMAEITEIMERRRVPSEVTEEIARILKTEVRPPARLIEEKGGEEIGLGEE